MVTEVAEPVGELVEPAEATVISTGSTSSLTTGSLTEVRNALHALLKNKMMTP